MKHILIILAGILKPLVSLDLLLKNEMSVSHLKKHRHGDTGF